MTSLIMHVDMDAFFAAVEQRDHPEYRGKPVVVGAQPGQRGVVATCSYEARRFGIRSAMPISEAYRRCPTAIFVSPNGERYVEASEQIMNCLSNISPLVEPVSIDEAYVDVSGLENLFGPPQAVGQLTKDRIFAATELTASVGIGPNRLIAKLASDFDKPDGLTYVPDAQVLEFLAPMPIASLRGVGKKTLPRLAMLGAHTLGELRTFKLTQLEQALGERLAQSVYQQVRGIGSNVIHMGHEHKSISKETTFEQDQVDERVLRETLRSLAAEVGFRARKKGFCGNVVTLKLRLENFSTLTRQKRLQQSTQSDRVLFQTSWQLYHESGLSHRPLRLIGLGISDREEGQPLQGDLFAGQAEGSQEELYEVMDRVTDRFGRAALQFGLKQPKK